MFTFFCLKVVQPFWSTFGHFYNTEQFAFHSYYYHVYSTVYIMAPFVIMYIMHERCKGQKANYQSVKNICIRLRKSLHNNRESSAGVRISLMNAENDCYSACHEREAGNPWTISLNFTKFS